MSGFLAVAAVAFKSFLHHLTSDVAKVQTFAVSVVVFSYLLSFHVLIRAEVWLLSGVVVKGAYVRGLCVRLRCS